MFIGNSCDSPSVVRPPVNILFRVTHISQICINIHPDAVPPIHAESYHVATDNGPLQVPVYF